MAGEFPDRSKQRESSAEPTSGSASPVPEARGEVRDPRLAVARDTEPPAAHGGVDTATRVFSARDVAQARAAAQETKPTPPGTPDDAATATEGPEDAEKPGAGDAEGAEGSAKAGAGAPEAAEGAKAAPATEDVQDAVPTDAAEADGGPAKDAEDSAAAEDVQDAVPTDSAAGARDVKPSAAAVDPRARVADATEGAKGAAATDSVPVKGTGAGDAAAAGESAPAGAEGAARAAGDRAAVPEAAAAAEDVQDAVPADSAEDAAGSAETDGGPVKGAEGAGEAPAVEEIRDAVPAGAEGSQDAAAAEDVQDAVPADSAEDAAGSAETDGGPVKGAEGAGEASAVEEVQDAVPAGGAEDVQDAVPVDGAEGSRDAEASAAPEEAPPAGAEGATGAGVPKGAGDAAAAEDVQDAVPADSAEDSRDAEGSAASAWAEGEPGGDARLRAAVAAWVRSGDSAGAADSGAEDGERPAGAAKADPRATEDPSDAVDAREKSAQATSATEDPGDAVDAREESAPAPRATEDPGDAVDAREESAPAPRATPGPSDAVDAREESAQATREAGDKGDEAAPKGDGEAGARVDQPTTMLKLPSKFVALKPDVTTAIPQVGPERTTQQPLPPKPPLDLLAELTNTPPPPQTPLRTTFRRVKIWTPLVLLLAVVFAVAQSMRPLPTPSLELTAEDSYSFDGGKVDIPWPAEGQAALDVQGIGSFGSSGDQKPVPIASVAKVMTAYVILRDHPLKSGAAGPKIKIDQTAEAQSKAGQESTVNVTAGDSISQREALESILIASANNVARLLARWDAGSEKAFVEKMNAAAEDLGMTNTTYTDPSGLNNTTVSTAVDQVKLGKKAMEEPAFREVAAMMSYDDYKGVNHPNWNQIVGKNNVVGIKTGTTTSALGNLLFAAKKEVDGETRTIVGAVVRQPAGGVDNTILSAALTAGDQLIRAAQGALESATILKKGDVVGYVDDGLGGRTPVVATKDVTAVGWSGLTVKLTFAADDVPHTAKAGTKVGTLTVGDASAGAVKVPVALQKDLVEPGFTDKLTRIT
ncbi:D-alanyl-D-alanine carboxypeptidase [Streptomyces sp. NPDC058642]|uniref:D-alanyl-D-alanine carboxypeptidase n=1 Tax=Streptomyces sp. NPDC058642 TaxID=3346572 RepID=UPI003654BE51